MILLLFALQAGAPDIQLQATVQARSLTIQKQGEAKLEVYADPDAGSLVKIEAPKANGTKTLRNVEVRINAEARLANGAGAAATDRPKPR